MPRRTLPLVNGEYYHVYNRGVALQPTYFTKKDYERFILCLSYYRYNKLPFKLSRLLQIPKDERDLTIKNLKTCNDKSIELIAFCLMPNHFHILIRQISDGGISRFIKQITDSYTRYVNTKLERIGPLYQGAFKAVHVESDEQLIHLSRYIHLNPLVSFVVRNEEFLSYPWSSLSRYLNKDYDLVNPKIILDNFKSENNYFEFVMDQADYGKELEKIKHLTLD